MRSRFLLLALFIALSAPIAVAQVNSATVTGIVTDESKGVLPGTTVTATDLETGRKFVAVSDGRSSHSMAAAACSAAAERSQRLPRAPGRVGRALSLRSSRRAVRCIASQRSASASATTVSQSLHRCPPRYALLPSWQ